MKVKPEQTNEGNIKFSLFTEGLNLSYYQSLLINILIIKQELISLRMCTYFGTIFGLTTINNYISFLYADCLLKTVQ